MKLRADKIEYENDKIIVTGTTEIGKLKGVWKYREQPVVKYTYFIELSYEKFEKRYLKVQYIILAHSYVMIWLFLTVKLKI